MAKFGVVGLANTIVDFGVFSLLVWAGLAPVAANFVSFLCANGQSYFLNSRFTFRNEGRAAPVSAKGYGKFLVAHLMSLALSTLVIALFHDDIGPRVAKAVAIILSFGWNYLASAIFVFRKSPSRENGDAS